MDVATRLAPSELDDLPLAEDFTDAQRHAVARALAGNTATPPDALRRLASSPDEGVRHKVRANPASDAATITARETPLGASRRERQ